MCLIASVCFWAVENYWAKSSTAPLKRPAQEMGVSRKRVRSASLISARLSHRCLSWTSCGLLDVSGLHLAQGACGHLCRSESEVGGGTQLIKELICPRACP
ncbi:hypothetical protein PO909_012942 [Leuciscus waleckii]